MKKKHRAVSNQKFGRKRKKWGFVTGGNITCQGESLPGGPFKKERAPGGTQTRISAVPTHQLL